MLQTAHRTDLDPYICSQVNTPSQPSKFWTKNWVERNYYSYRMYNTNSQIKFKIILLKSSLRDYSNEFILVRKIITVVGAEADNSLKCL